MALTVKASDGNDLPIDNLAQTFNYTGAVLTSISVQYQAIVNFAPVTKTYTQTFTYSGSLLTNISQWTPS